MHCLWDQLRRSDLEISGLVPETPRVDRQLLAAHTSLQPCCVLRRRVGPEKRWDCKKHQEGQPSQGKAEMSQAHQMGQTNHTEVALMFGRAASQGRQKRLRVIEDPKRRQCEERNMPFLSLPMLFFKAVHDCEETALHRAPQQGHDKPPTHAGGKHSATLHAASCPGWLPLFRFIKC